MDCLFLEGKKTNREREKLKYCLEKSPKRRFKRALAKRSQKQFILVLTVACPGGWKVLVWSTVI